MQKAARFDPEIEDNHCLPPEIAITLTIFWQLDGDVSSVWTSAYCNSSHTTCVGVVGV